MNLGRNQPFLTEDISRQDCAFENKLTRIEGVELVEFIPKEDALN